MGSCGIMFFEGVFQIVGQILGLMADFGSCFREFTRKLLQVGALFDEGGYVVLKFIACLCHVATSVRLSKRSITSSLLYTCFARPAAIAGVTLSVR
jgi:hypothetical protein